VTDPAYCLDTGVFVKALIPEEGSREAAILLKAVIGRGHRLVAPSFAWAEVGTVLREKVRTGLLTEAEAGVRWERFLSLPIEYLEDRRLLRVAWEIAARFGLHAIYDAAFLAAAEVAAEGGEAEFWTCDRELVKSLGDRVPQYVHLLGG